MKKTWARNVIAITGGLAGTALGAVAVGTLLWNRATARAVRESLPDAPMGTAKFSPEELTGLPEPVVRYFNFALTPGQPLIRSARLEQEGEFRGGLDAPWSPFTAVQHFSAYPRAFVWDASIRMAPLLTVRVRDSYIGGTGGMQARMAGVIPIMNQSDRPGLNAGALLRYLAESAWFPTALLPAQGIVWEAIDGNTARATLTDSETTISLDFHFGLKGEIVRVYTPARFREVNGEDVPTPWEGAFGDYERVEGVMVPKQGEVAWILPEGRLTYWRGRIRGVHFES